MPPLKFRAFDKLTRSMSEPTKDGNKWENGDSERYVTMQWTGLLDRNGVEIYEGDIVRLWIDEEDGHTSKLPGFGVWPILC